MTLNQAPPIIPEVGTYGILDLKDLGGRQLFSEIKLANAPVGEYVHAIWRGTKANGESVDLIRESRLIFVADQLLRDAFPNNVLTELDQGHVLYSYTFQPSIDFTPGFEESRRLAFLVGVRSFPGTGIHMPVIHAAHEAKFSRDDIPGAGAAVAVAPWQAMQAGDRLILTWHAYRPDGSKRTYIGEWEVSPEDVDQPMALNIPKVEILYASGGHGELSYVVEYAGGGQTVSPMQHFDVVAAPATRLPVLEIVEQSGDSLDPSLLPDFLTFRIAHYPDLREGDVLVIYAQDTTLEPLPAFPIAAIRLDRSAVDSGLLECVGASAWLDEFVDRTVSITYHLARPGLALASEPLVLPVRLAMVLPAPVVQGASGTGTGAGEFKAQLTGSGIKVWVPSAAFYPTDASLEMHWLSVDGFGSVVVPVPTDDTPPAFIISPAAVAPNLGKTVQVFYRVKPAVGSAQDSQAFSLKVLPVPENQYPLLICAEADAATRVLRLASVGTAGAGLSVARWPLIAAGQRVDVSVAGTLASGEAVSKYIFEGHVLTTAQEVAGLSARLAKSWLQALQIGSEITFTVRVTADEGLTHVLFPRASLTLRA